MRAAVFLGDGVLAVQDVSEPVIKERDEVILRVAANGVCGTDVHALDVPPKVAFTPGVVIGHEFSGTVVEAGPDSGFSVGESVGVLPQIPCYLCARCRAGKVNLCSSMSVFGAYDRNGGAAEYVVVPRETLHRLPAGLDVRRAALAEPLAVTLSASTRVPWHPGRSALVMGAGPIGLLFMLLAKRAGAWPIIVAEPSVGRRERAAALGADFVVDPNKDDVVEFVRDTLGDGADVVVDAVGTLLPQGIAAAATGATVVVYGINESASVNVPPYQILRKELTITGTFLAKNTFPLALSLLAEDSLGLDRIVETFPLEQAGDAVDRLRSGDAVKALLLP
jgi:2-desacetyl-2-hydroxyethyl bacteriochlorophyllide A dehydrogenase